MWLKIGVGEQVVHQQVPEIAESSTFAELNSKKLKFSQNCDSFLKKCEN